MDLLAMADTVKVAILGDMFELGEDSHALHEETGAYAAAAGIDRIYCVGREAEYMYRAARDQSARPALTGDDSDASVQPVLPEVVCVQTSQILSGAAVQVMYFPTKDDLLKALERDPAQYVPAGSTVLVKASHGMEFTEIVEMLKNL